MQGKLQGLPVPANPLESVSDMTCLTKTQTVTFQLTAPIYQALEKAAASTRTTPAEYVEEVLLVDLAERGLLKQR